VATELGEEPANDMEDEGVCKLSMSGNSFWRLNDDTGRFPEFPGSVVPQVPSAVRKRVDS
jgi:hypothetical protein